MTVTFHGADDAPVLAVQTGSQSATVGSPFSLTLPTGTFTGEKDSHGREKFISTWNWRSTTAPNKIYLEIFQWPTTGSFHLDKLPRNVTGAYLLADKAHKPLKITKVGTGLDITLPAQPLDPIATVVVLNTN